jgi:predicted XRE-type DNA-binding protein
MSIDTAIGLALQGIGAVWQAASDAQSNKENCKAMAQAVMRMKPWLESLQAEGSSRLQELLEVRCTVP